MKKSTRLFNKFAWLAFVCLSAMGFRLQSQGCVVPSNLQVVAYTNNSLTLDWTSGGATNWQVRFVPQGGNLNFASPLNVTSKPFTITGLNQAATYAIQVRDSCSSSSFSNWTPFVLGTTACNVVTAPFTTNFDGAAWTTGPGTISPGSINVCWRRNPQTATGRFWKTGPPAFVFNSGAANDHTTGSGKYVYIETASFLIQADSAQFESPLIDLSSLTNPQLVFWYHMFGGDIEELRVLVSDDNGLTYTRVDTISGPQQSSTTDPWKERVVNLSAYANQTIRVRFEAFEQTPGFNNAICIDDFEIREAPSCPRPTNFAVNSIGSNQVVLGWTSGGASNWQVEYGSPGFTPGSGTQVNASSNPFTLTGLSANTAYDFYVRDSCGLGDVSTWTGPLSFTTRCAPFSTPYSENFDGSNFSPGTGFTAIGTIDNCWLRNSTTGFFWKPGPPTFTATNTGPSGDNTSGSGQYLYSENLSTLGSNRTRIETPLIDLSNLNNPQLRFFVHMFGIDISALRTYADTGSGWILINTQSGQQQSSNGAAWKEVIVSLSNYANQIIQFRFEAERTPNGFSADMAIDDLFVEEAPTCPKPQNLASTGVGVNTAGFSWTSGGANNWQISLVAGGGAAATGNIVNTSNNPAQIPGLLANTIYDVYVRDSCGPGDVSAWSGPIRINTLCNPVSAPYAENFDGNGFTLPTGFNNPGGFPACWVRPTGDNYVWSVGDDDNNSFSTGPTADHTTGSGKFLFTEGLFAFGGVLSSRQAELRTPTVDLSNVTLPQLSFWYHMYGTDIDSLAVFVDNGQRSQRVWGLSGQQQSSATAAWLEAVISLPSFAGDTVSVFFKAYRANAFTAAEIAIDDLRLEETPNCPKPNGISLNSATSTSLSLSWTSGGANNWQIEYGPVGFIQGNGTLVNAASNPFTLSGLNPSTQYQVYLRDSCGPGDVSLWTGPFNARTLCGPTPAPLLETFDGSNFTPGIFFNDPGDIDPCWSRSDTVNYHWTPETGQAVFGTGPSADHTTGNGDYLITLVLFFGGSDTTTLTSYAIDLSPLNVPQLRFYSHMFGPDINLLDVEINNGSGWTRELRLSGQQQAAQTDPWQEQVVNLNSYANDTIQVRFVAVRNSGTFSTGAGISIDDFEVREAPSCPRPTGLTVTGTSSNSVNLSWTSGGATNWQIRYRISGSSGTFTTVNANTNPFVLSGLNPSTTYDIEVRDSCGAGDVSLWTGPVTASTTCGVITAPWFESFDGGNWIVGNGGQNTNNQIDPCWTRPGNSIDFGTGQGGTTSFGTGPSQDVSGSGKYLYTETSGGSFGINAGEISSPEVFVPNNLNNPFLRFGYHMHGNTISALEVEISQNGGSFTNVFTLSGQQQSSETDPWQFDSVSLSAYQGDTLRFRFIGRRTGSFRSDIAIDEVEVKGTLLPCQDPTNLSFSNIGQSNFDLSWQSANANAQTTVRYYETALGAASATVIPNAGSPLSLTNLNPGTNYTVELTDSCANGGLSGTVSDTISTLFCPAVTANFSSNANFLGVNFNSAGTLNADSLRWLFDASNTSNAQNPFYVFPAAGTYSVTLFAFNDCGNADTLTQSITVCDTLEIAFRIENRSDSVVFDADSSQGVSGYIWDLDEGFTSNQSRVAVSYPTTGTKTITLTVFNDCGDTLRQTRTIDVCPLPVASWTYTILSPVNGGLRIQFDASASQNASTFNWDFGDGNTGTGVNPIHVYYTPGLFYLVRLTVQNSCGGQDARAFALNEISLPENLPAQAVKLYPQPARENYRLSWDSRVLKVQKINLYSSNGQLLRSWPLADPREDTWEGDATAWPNGLYWLELVAEQQRIQKRLMIRK